MAKIDNSKTTPILDELLEAKDFMNHISVDCTIFGFHEKSLKILLLKHHDVDLWAVPGGFVFHDEDLRVAASRVLYERTHLKDLFLDQFYTFGSMTRNETNNLNKILLENKGIEIPKENWIFQRFITVGYCSLVDYTLTETFPDASSEVCQWFEVDQLPNMAFDHEKIIKKGLKHIRKNLDTQLVAYNLLPEKFTMMDLQNLYETVLGETFRRNNFPRKMLSLGTLDRLEKFYDGSANKAPYLYKFKDNLKDFLD